MYLRNWTSQNICCIIFFTYIWTRNHTTQNLYMNIFYPVYTSLLHVFTITGHFLIKFSVFKLKLCRLLSFGINICSDLEEHFILPLLHPYKLISSIVMTDHSQYLWCNLKPWFVSVREVSLDISRTFLSPYVWFLCEKYCILWPNMRPSRLEHVSHCLWMKHIPVINFLCLVRRHLSIHFIVAITLLVVTMCICSSSSVICGEI
jgi:hypothetical protein